MKSYDSLIIIRFEVNMQRGDLMHRGRLFLGMEAFCVCQSHYLLL